ncbi:ATP-binding cassette domain-containing protein [Nostoc sp. DedSLP04]|uniref:ATP-binding cassette domain-containing protein n=1 Tax=Nostoc sp. DedSLP04 TaxID=3075401 RepID=UPI002AD2B278|nr:ATP-binding cassette domain-containing protein [Nostoc sp. DedSLP04]MDZ8029576.1 ATP-binding cassette domain-containing protein [Nostoc sp. DedSLP04]
MSNEPIIVIKNLNHYYGKGQLRKQILFDISLKIYPGEIVIMSGPSGSGKTTLLTLIGGLRSVQEGSLQILGHELSKASNRLLENVRKQIGFIFQAHNLLGSLTANQNVQMSLVLNDAIAMEEAQERSQAILEQVGLQKRIHSYPHQLSGGQKQRVAIARALVNRPQLILADEPTAALDKASGRDVVELMQKLAKQQNCTILLVTHDNRILDIADRIVHLEDGRLASPTEQAILDIESTTTSLVKAKKEELSRTLEELTIPQFLSLLQKLKEEFEQVLQAMNILSEQMLKANIEEVIRALAWKIAQIMGADRATIFVVDREKNQLWSKVSRSENEEAVEIFLPMNDSISGYVATTGESVNITDVQQNPQFYREIDRATGYHTCNILCLPMFNSKNQVFAVVVLTNKLGGSPFDANDERLLRELTAPLSVILEGTLSVLQQ